ncbi:hypothetical protein [Hymenobacter sp. CRA2]|uniref:hypothetical protein n=1 Tax=Hymenobacter sp. CRA2 TaxID=1955620 RepID=UPI00098FBAFA|nr:hypothetical protein [Hymenobacter sp. CRA2]OON68975.1 hypothetical protein B0919_09675 [Hymenobacter sp. CRA2]
MYQDELNQLIEATIADGQLTAKERKVLLRRAQSFGVDMDEFEVYLDGLLFKRREELAFWRDSEDDEAATEDSFEEAEVEEGRGHDAQRGSFAHKPQNRRQMEAGRSARGHGDMSKCPACKEIISGLSHVCPSCGLVIDADHDAHGSLEEMMEEQESILLEAKALARRSAAPATGGVSYLAVPLGIIVLGAVAIEWNWTVLGFSLWALAVVVYRVLRKKQRPSSSTNADAPLRLAALRDAFEKNERQMTLFFGADRKVTQVLGTLNREMASLGGATEPAAPTQTQTKRLLRVAIVATILLVPVASSIFRQRDEEVLKQAQAALDYGRLEEARALTDDLHWDDARVTLAAQIQGQELSHRLDSLEALLPLKHYSAVQQQLQQLTWRPNPTSITWTAPASRTPRRAFLARKAALNEQLPARYRVAVDTTLVE